MEENATGPDYSGILNEINQTLKDQKNYLNEKELYFRECVLRLYVNNEFDNNKKNKKMLIKDSIDRAYDLTKEVFNRIRFD